MAEPGDPSNPDDHDDLIGFASPASLIGRLREPPAPEPMPEPEPEPEPMPIAAVPGPERAVEATIPGPLPRSRARSRPKPGPENPAGSVDEPEAEAELEPALLPETRPVEASSIFEPSREFSNRASRRRQTPERVPGGGMGLFAVYALILFSVPTVGVSALLGLLAVTGRSGPEDPLSRSHFVYQQRTLWAAAVVTLAGIILLVAATFALGVPTLFFLACWMALRGASGVWALKAGRPIANPRGWWI